MSAHPFLKEVPTAEQVLASTEVTMFKNIYMNLAIGQIYRLRPRPRVVLHPTEAFVRIERIFEYKPPVLSDGNEDDEDEVAQKTIAMVETHRVLRGRDIHDDPTLVWCPEGSSVSLVDGCDQLVDTDKKVAFWGAQLQDRIHAVEFEPSERGMPVCADALGWVRKDINLIEDIQCDHVPSMWILVPTVAPMCVAECPTPNVFPGDDFWRLCTLCDDGEGRWYHQRCLRHPSLQEREVPPWMYHLPGFSYDKWRHGLWQSLRDLPITRGC
ncbi:hypothetical protein K466DRAFT_571283, partial [Polyporus arcularius HHB13444]